MSATYVGANAKGEGLTKGGGEDSADNAGNSVRAKVARPDAAASNSSENPHVVCQLRDFCGIHRATAAATGADGRAYFGGVWYRDGKAGGLAWWDPKTKQGGGFWEPFSTYQVVHMAAADQGRYIVLSTMVVPDLVLKKPTPKQAKLFVYDTAAERMAAEIEPVEGAASTGLIAAGPGASVMGIVRDPTDNDTFLVYGVDLASQHVKYRTKVPAPPAEKERGELTERHGFRLGPDGRLWLIHMGAMLRIDPADDSWEVVGRLSLGDKHTASPYNLIAFSGSDLYLAGAERLRRLRGIVPLP